MVKSCFLPLNKRGLLHQVSCAVQALLAGNESPDKKQQHVLGKVDKGESKEESCRDSSSNKTKLWLRRRYLSLLED